MVKASAASQGPINLAVELWHVAMAAPKKVHFESVHEEKKPYKCDICDKSFPLKSVLQTHIGSVHKKKNPFKCEICDYRCSQKGDLKKHMKTIH